MAQSNEGLVRELQEEGAIRSVRVKKAFEKTDRANFVPDGQKKFAYADCPLPIGEGQTISQPWTVAVMTEALGVKEGMKILEVGTGSGYQAAILAELAGKSGLVVTTEVRKKLFEFAKGNLRQYKNVFVVMADGSKGFLGEAPYDRIIVTAAGTKFPDEMWSQLKEGGIIVIPIGDEMHKIERISGKERRTFLGYFAFVPLKE